MFALSGGGSDDFAYNAGFKFSYTMELREAEDLSGFHPPVSMIETLVKETWIGIRAMAKKIIEIEAN